MEHLDLSAVGHAAGSLRPVDFHAGVGLHKSQPYVSRAGDDNLNLRGCGLMRGVIYPSELLHPEASSNEGAIPQATWRGFSFQMHSTLMCMLEPLCRP